jgi:trimethyllysine dioxygenase
VGIEGDVELFYSALKEWIVVLDEMQVEYALQPGKSMSVIKGTVVAINNWRVLHGRRSFTGTRRVEGAYLGMDDIYARVRQLEQINKK